MRKGLFGRTGWLAVSLSLALLLFLTVPAMALTTQDVAVTATPAYVEITNTPALYAFGTVQASTAYNTTTGNFTVTNGSTVTTNVTIGVTTTTWAGGIVWNHSETNAPAADTAGMASSNNTGAFDVIVRNASPLKIYTDLPDKTISPQFRWELQLNTPTSYSDGVGKSITVRLTASQT